jgi:hypothetical protein
MQLSGQYAVMFKHPNISANDSKIETFRGICENFVTTGICAFSNDENEMLIVSYKDIVQMKPIRK